MSHVIWYPGHERLQDPIVRAENCSLYDAKGKHYVDLESGVWCTSVGHAHPRVLEVMTEQAGQLAHTGFSYSSDVVEKAAEESLALHGFEGGGCTFLCSGSEAVEYGVRVARELSERPLFITMVDSYFGAYGSACSREADAWFSFDWSGCESCPHEGPCGNSCDRWSEIPFEKIGGFLFEPGSSSGFVRFPPNKLIAGLDEAVRENGGLVLVNEVTTGIGRTGKWFGYQHYDITPDIVAMGKGIGNGYPVSMAAVSPRVTGMLGDTPIAYSQSHQNDPLGAAIAREVIRIIHHDNLIERSDELSRVLVQGLYDIKERTAGIKEIRSRGLMVAMDLVDHSDGELTTDVHLALRQKGFLVGRRPGTNTLRLDPSLTLEKEDLRGFLATFEECLEQR